MLRSLNARDLFGLTWSVVKKACDSTQIESRLEVTVMRKVFQVLQQPLITGSLGNRHLPVL